MIANAARRDARQARLVATGERPLRARPNLRRLRRASPERFA
jgi:hypothetical protein